MTYIYVASPYSHEDPQIREHRFRQVSYYVSSLLLRKQWCYSPIVHCHELAKTFRLPTSFEFWAEYNFTMLDAAAALHVLQLEGWNNSTGVAAEVAFWKRQDHKPAAVFVGYNKK